MKWNSPLRTRRRAPVSRIGHPLALSPRSGRTTSFFNVHFSSLPFFHGRARRTWSIHERSARPISRGIASGSATERESSADGHAAPARERMSARNRSRSEEHTSELQSHSDLVCRLLLEKKKRARLS